MKHLLVDAHPGKKVKKGLVVTVHVMKIYG
jgi:hypothetical protein